MRQRKGIEKVAPRKASQPTVRSRNGVPFTLYLPLDINGRLQQLGEEYRRTKTSIVLQALELLFQQVDRGQLSLSFDE